MNKVHLPINVSFLIILIAVLVLAIMQGETINNVLLGKAEIIGGNEIQQIAFVILTIFILITATLHPDKLYLSSYSSMTLGLIVVIGSFYNFYAFKTENSLFQFLIGIILIISGALLFKSIRLTGDEKRVVSKGIKHYRKSYKKS